jgi:hypothetical protein
LDHAGQEGLFRVVCDVWPYAVDDATEVAIWCQHNIRIGHRRPKTVKDVGKGIVKELPAEPTEFDVIGISFVRCESI